MEELSEQGLEHRRRRQLRVGMQLKLVLIVTALVIAVSVSGGWLYFWTTRGMLRQRDYQRAQRLGEALCLAAGVGLERGDVQSLRRLAEEHVRRGDVVQAAILDADGRAVAAAGRAHGARPCAGLPALPVTVSDINQASDDALTLAMPVVARDEAGKQGRLLGAARLALDTSGTTTALVRTQRRVVLIGASVVLCAIPLGYLLAWRALLQPVRRLVGAARRLGGGDFSARANMPRNDELGELAATFDAMAQTVAESRDRLLRANERLERRVAERTQELRRTNARLREEMVEREEFLRAVSHDLNAPLRNIAGMTAMVLLRHEAELSEDVVVRLKRIQANVEAQTALISDLLELSRIRTRPERRQATDLGALVESVARTFEYELRNRRIHLTIRAPMPNLCLERNRMRQVFQNLIDNAIKHMHRPEGGLIEVSYRAVRGMHQFRVADNGPGIAPEEHERIFQVFRRARRASSTGVEGRGVGLAVVKSVVANYHGRAWVRSQPGQGASFFVALRAESAPASRQEQHDVVVGAEEVSADCHPVG